MSTRLTGAAVHSTSQTTKNGTETDHGPCPVHRPLRLRVCGYINSFSNPVRCVVGPRTVLAYQGHLEIEGGSMLTAPRVDDRTTWQRACRRVLRVRISTGKGDGNGSRTLSIRPPLAPRLRPYVSSFHQRSSQHVVSRTLLAY